MTRLIRFLILVLLFLSSGRIFATHIRAANITAVRIGLTKYRIVLSVYTDYNNVVDNPNANQNSAINVSKLEIGLGDQQNPLAEITVNRSSITEIVPGETFENIYTLDYDFPSAFAGYKIFFVGQNRNENVININESVNSFIYVETYVFIDGFSPINSSPEFTVPPIDHATTNQIYTHNPGAFDLDGDSLSFELIDPRDRVDKSVDGYRYPDDPSFGTPSNFSIDSKTGQITWNTPKTPGEYNIAFRVNEYRNGNLIGFVVRDMQINVFPSNNEPPIVQMPPDTCISVGQDYRASVSASDPNNNTIKMELYGGFKELGGEIESMFSISPDVIFANVYWKPDCDAVGERPIQGIIRVTDNHPVSLSTVQTWNIQVIAKAIENVKAEAQSNQIKLSWSSYACTKNRAKIEIYRRECDNSPINRNACTSGVPSEWGFTKIGEVNASDTSFIDNGSVKGLSSGISYYYILSVKFSTPSYGESYASEIVSASLSNESPLFTQISFNKAQEDKFLDISWNHFSEVDTSSFDRPFTYQVTNATNIIYSTQSADVLNQSIFIDTLNLDFSKTFELSLLDKNGAQIASKSIGYGERLSANGSDESLILNWTNKNYWFYSDTLQQEIYSFKKGQDTVLIDSVFGGNTTYTISDLENGDTVCAYVKVKYSYCLEGIDTTFTSFTNTSCSVIRDNVAPCPPILSLEKINCDIDPIGNTLNWLKGNCKDDIASITLFKQELVGQSTFVEIENFEPFVLDFLDLGGKELSCYYLQATDYSGNVSAKSNTVCQDFCGAIVMPNVFTPNGDGKNDFLTTESVFTGYDELIFLVYNRWGKEIHREVDFTTIKWDGISDNGKPVGDGTYFIYLSGRKLTGNQEKVEYKGWLEVIR